MGRTSHRQRRWIAIAASVMAGVALSVAATAFACTIAATVKLDQETGIVGSTVTGTGKNFDGTAIAKPVEVRFDSLDGPVIWSGVANSVGNIVFSFKAPEVAPGTYTVVVTQRNPTNENFRNGTPARATFTVQAAPAAIVPVSPQTTKPTTQPQAPARHPAQARAQRPASRDRSTTRPAPAAVRPAPASVPSRSVAPASVPSRSVAPASAAQPARSPSRSASRGAQGRSGQAAPSRLATRSEPHNAAVASAPQSSRRSVMVSPAAGAGSSGLPTLVALIMLGIGCVLSLGATGLVLASRRSEKVAPAEAGRE